MVKPVSGCLDRTRRDAALALGGLAPQAAQRGGDKGGGGEGYEEED